MKDSFAIAEALRDFGVEFVIIGGHAVIRHGVSRTTEDLDVVYDKTPDNVDRLFEAVRSVGGVIITNDIDPVTRLEIDRPVTRSDLTGWLALIATDHGFFDAFSYVPGVDEMTFDQLFQDSVLLDGFHFASIDALRKMKAAAGRPRDLEDLKALADDDG